MGCSGAGSTVLPGTFVQASAFCLFRLRGKGLRFSGKGRLLGLKPAFLTSGQTLGQGGMGIQSVRWWG